MPLDLGFVHSVLGSGTNLHSVHSDGALPLAGISIAGISIDSRTLQRGELFAAVQGPRFDGHDFIEDAVKRGCSAILAHNNRLFRAVRNLSASVPVIGVPDVLKALGVLATAWRGKVAPSVIAVTGSSGKTTVKDMLVACLRKKFRAHATDGNKNNHIGVPLTILAMPENCEVLIVEMGMNGPGEIAELAAMARPDVGVITTIQPAHIGAFENLEGIARAKGELLAALPKSGAAILPAEDLFTPLLRSLTPCAVHCFDGSGEYRARNVSVVMTVAEMFGLSRERCLSILKQFSPSLGRGVVQHNHRAGWTVIDDSYNANPGSMRAALRMLGNYPVSAKGRRVAILGDMLELGETSEQWHRALVEPLHQHGIELLVTVGSRMRILEQLVRMPVSHLSETAMETAMETVIAMVRSEDVVLVKGSRGMRTERIVRVLLE